jgi:hypothetical protein
MGSIPIARSINLVDSVALTPRNHQILPLRTGILFQRCSKGFVVVPKVLGLPTGERGSEKPSFYSPQD